MRMWVFAALTACSRRALERIEVYRDDKGALERTRWRFVRQ